MPDPISTIALATGGAFLGKFVGPAAEHLGKMALERAQQLGQKATALLATVGRKPQPVEPKLLVPLVQAASLETDEALAAHWAALLANAADPAQQLQVQPAFIEVLRQLTPTDAQVLDYLYRNRPRLSVDNEVMPDKIMAVKLVADLGLPPADIGLSIDNLFRLWLCAKPNGLGGTISLNVNSTNYSLLPTILGQSFYDAVTPPIP